MNPVASVGRATLNFLAAAGRLTLFAGTGVMHCVRPPFHFRLIAAR